MPTIEVRDPSMTFTAEAGVTLMAALRDAGFTLDAPCGGQGTCGKCIVYVAEAAKGPDAPLRPEKACQLHVTEDLVVSMDKPVENRILTQGTGNLIDVDPVVKSYDLKVDRCPIGEASTETGRIRRALALDPPPVIPLSLTRTVYRTLNEQDYQGNFVVVLDTLSAIRKADAPLYVLAFDIGTTTVVSYLLNGTTGEQLAVSSMLNPQTAYGADVVSRCEYAMTDDSDAQTHLIRKALSGLAKENAEKAGISMDDIWFATVVGNTCMQHLYLGIKPDSMIKAPYNATSEDMHFLTPKEAEMEINPMGRVCVLPVIAGFVGADTVGVLLSLADDTFDKLTLMIDIGTNGEMVLGKGDRRYTCSTAAGPAFEGAKITYGMRGADGAIDHVEAEGDELLIHVIGEGKPAGICGSGLIDLISSLRRLGIISARGRMEKPEKWPEGVRSRYAQRMVRRDNINAFLLTDDPDGVCLTQKDIREMQLAKAAIATGIELLCKEMGVKEEEIEQVLLAGAFGSFLRPESACAIGMLPMSLLARIRAIGNAAGEGAKAAAINRSILFHSLDVAKDIHFIELAVSDEFQNTYFNRLDFPAL